MAQTAKAIEDVNRLAASAAGNPQRNDIYLSVAQLFYVQAARLSDRERAVVRDILKRLAGGVDVTVRAALAERLADDPQAPRDLVRLLAEDALDVARPVILRSPVLDDGDIEALLANAALPRQAICAARPHIGEAVTARLASTGAEEVLLALLRNGTACIAIRTFEVLLDTSRRLPVLQEPLARRPDLPTPLAARLCGWLREPLRTDIIRARRLDAGIVDAMRDRAQGTDAPRAGNTDGSQKLVDKLAAAGQLKPGFLLRVLQQSQADLFDLAFAKLLDLEPGAFHEVFYRRGPRPVALACRAVGIDRCVFPTVYTLSRKGRSLNPALTTDERGEIDAVFCSFERKEALGVLRRLPAN